MKPQARAALVVLLLAICAVFASRVEVHSELASLVPDDGPTAQAIAVAQRHGLSDRVMVEVNGNGQSWQALRESVERVAQSLEGSGLFSRVRFRVELAEAMALERAARSVAPSLVPAPVLRERMTDEGIREALGHALVRLAGPNSGQTASQLATDPLDLGSLALSELQARAGPFRLQVKEGFLVNQTGERALIIAEPKERGVGARDGVPDAVRAAMAQAQLPVDWFGGRRVAEATEAAVRAEGQRLSLWGVLALLLVVVLGFRSPRPVLAALGPLVLALGFAAASAGLMGRVHGINLGMAGALMGLAVDYWIHLYMRASELGSGSSFAERYSLATRALGQLTPAFLMSAGTTTGAFLILGMSRFPVVQALGALGAGATVGALCGVMLAGPLVYGVFGGVALRWPPFAPRRPGLAVLAVAALTLAFALWAPGMQLEGDPRELAAPPEHVQAVERGLAERYGGLGTGALIAVRGDDDAEALDKAYRVFDALRELSGVGLTGPSVALPGPAAVAERRAVLAGAVDLPQRLAAIGDELGLRGEALVEGLALSLAAPSPVAGLWRDTPAQGLADQLVRDDRGSEALLHIVLEDDSLVQPVWGLATRAVPDAQVVIPALLAERGVRAIESEMLRLGGLCIGLVVMLALLRHRSLRLAVAAVLPVGAALLWIAGASSILGWPLNAVGMSGAVLTIGLAIDYGVFVTEGALAEHGSSSAWAIALSAATSLAGFGALIFAQTAALSNLGLVLVVGLTGATACALGVSAPLAAGWSPPRWVGRVGGAAAWLLLMGLNVQALLLMRFVAAPPLTTEAPGEVAGTLSDLMGVRVLNLKGSHYQMGVQHGLATLELRAVLERDTLDGFVRAVPNGWGRALIIEGVMIAGAGVADQLQPEYAKELSGLVDSGPDAHPWLWPNYTRKVYYHALHDIGQTLVDSPLVGCTGFMAGGEATADGHWLLGRDFDFEAGEVFDRDKVLIVRRPDDGLAHVSVAFAGMVGAVSGLNEAGIAVAVQAAGSDVQMGMGTPMALILREILERASSLDEAEAILNSRRGMVTDLVLVVDGEHGQAAVFEVNPERVHRLPAGELLGVSNHFRTPGFASDVENARRQVEQTTTPRLRRMEELLQANRGALDVTTGVEVLRDRAGAEGLALPRGHRWAINADVASHGVVIDATARTITVSTYPHLENRWLSYRLEDLLRGAITPEVAADRRDLDGAVQSTRARSLLHRARRLGAAEALPLLVRAAALMPAHPEVLMRLGLAQQALGLAEATGTLRAARDAHPENERERALLREEAP